MPVVNVAFPIYNSYNVLTP